MSLNLRGMLTSRNKSSLCLPDSFSIIIVTGQCNLDFLTDSLRLTDQKIQITLSSYIVFMKTVPTKQESIPLDSNCNEVLKAKIFVSAKDVENPQKFVNGN